jgi:glycine/D-amino acid oxidase-like deaminating enzyme
MLKYSQLSFWEKDIYFNDLDILIIGAGIVGYSSAIELKSRYPHKKVLIIERGNFPTGASTKNAGFTCFGSGSEILDDIANHNRNDVVELIKKRYNGLQILLNRCSHEIIDYKPTGSHELFTKTEKDINTYQKVMDNQLELNEIIEESTGIKNNYSDAENSFGFNHIYKLIKNNGEGQINTGKMMLRLHQLAVAKGVLTLFGTPFEKYECITDGLVKITTDQGSFLTKQLIFATNGLSKHLLPELDLSPARAQVMITRPLKKTISGTFHYDRGYFYFRNVGNRILIGGGRNLAFEEETTTTFENTPTITNELLRLLKEVILPGQDFSIEQKWSGIMGVGKSRNPIIKYLNNEKTVMFAVRLGGMGVALGSKIGEEILNLYENRNAN